MPDPRLQRTRETLPEGYQFGDAGRDIVEATFEYHGQSYFIRAPRSVLESGGDWPRYRAERREVDLRAVDHVSDTDGTEA